MIGRKTLVHFLNTVLGALIGVLALKFIALYMGDSLYGQVAYAMSLTGLVHAFMQFALGQAHKKKVAEGIDTADRIATFLWMQSGLMLAYVVVVMGFIVARVTIQGRGFTDTTLLTIVVMAVYWATRFLWKWARGTLVAHQEIARDQAADVAEDFVRAGGSALVAASYAAVANRTGPLEGLFGMDADWLAAYGAEALAATYLVGSLVAVAIAVYYVARHHEIGTFRWDIVTDYWGFSRPLYLVAILGTISGKVDRIMLGYFWSDATVGLYFGADRVVSIVNTISFSIGALLLPEISSLSVDGSEEEIVTVVGKAHRYTTMIVLPMVFGLIFFAEPVINLILADEFVRGTTVLGVLAVYTLLNVISSPYASVVSGMDMPQLAARVGFAAAGTNIVLNLVLVPADIKSLGIELAGLAALGAALATATAGVVRYTFFRHVAGSIVDLEPQWHHFLRQAVAGAVMIAGLKVIDAQVVALHRWYHFILYGVVGGVVYLAAMVLLREFTRDDLDFFLEMAHPGKMVDYISEELIGRA